MEPSPMPASWYHVVFRWIARRKWSCQRRRRHQQRRVRRVPSRTIRVYHASNRLAYALHQTRSPAGGRLADEEEKVNVAALQDKLDSISREHGEAYIIRVQPAFEPLKGRLFDSSWNWVRQDALTVFYDIVFGRLATVDRKDTSRRIDIMNRADPTLIQ